MPGSGETPVQRIARQFSQILANTTQLNVNKHKVKQTVELGKGAKTLAHMKSGQRK